MKYFYDDIYAESRMTGENSFGLTVSSQFSTLQDSSRFSICGSSVRISTSTARRLESSRLTLPVAECLFSSEPLSFLDLIKYRNSTYPLSAIYLIADSSYKHSFVMLVDCYDNISFVFIPCTYSYSQIEYSPRDTVKYHGKSFTKFCAHLSQGNFVCYELTSPLCDLSFLNTLESSYIETLYQDMKNSYYSLFKKFETTCSLLAITESFRNAPYPFDPFGAAADVLGIPYVIKYKKYCADIFSSLFSSDTPKILIDAFKFWFISYADFNNYLSSCLIFEDRFSCLCPLMESDILNIVTSIFEYNSNPELFAPVLPLMSFEEYENLDSVKSSDNSMSYGEYLSKAFPFLKHFESSIQRLSFEKPFYKQPLLKVLVETLDLNPIY